MKKTYDLQKSVGYLVNRVAKEMRDLLERRMLPHGVTAHQWAILIHVYGGEAQTGKALADLLGIDGAAVSRLVDRLVAKGLLVRKPHEKDRRSWIVSMTPKGRQVTEQLPPIARGVLNQFLNGFSEKETTLLISSLKRMLNNARREE
jgi:DNA-binding MarR family transcriptional regulator